MADLKEIKKRLLRKVNKGSINSGLLTLDELVTLRNFITDPSDNNCAEYVIAKLGAEKELLIAKEVPPERWPKQLQGDWVKGVYDSLGLECVEPTVEEVPSPPQAEAPVMAPVPPSPVDKFEPPAPEPVPQKLDDITRSDSYGDVLGEPNTGDPRLDEILRWKRDRFK